MAKRKSKSLKKWLTLAVAVFCVVMAINEVLPQPLLPTWDQLFQTAGLAGDGDITVQGELQVTVLDVGNADAIVLSNNGKHMLIDAGERGDGDTVVAYLQQHNIDTLDYVIATHADSDHIGGMQTVLENVEVKKYIMSFMPEGYTPTTKTYMNLLETIDDRDIPLGEAKVGERFTFGDAYVDILGPAADFHNNNDQSVVCKVTFGSRRFLFMGDAGEDAEEALLQSGADLQADVLKMGHHGSAGSSSKTFLNRVRPRIALVTCGEGNSYGHPHTEALQRIRALDAAVYRSDLNGNITLRCDGDKISVSVQKGEAA